MNWWMLSAWMHELRLPCLHFRLCLLSGCVLIHRTCLFETNIFQHCECSSLNSTHSDLKCYFSFLRKSAISVWRRNCSFPTRNTSRCVALPTTFHRKPHLPLHRLITSHSWSALTLIGRVLHLPGMRYHVLPTHCIYNRPLQHLAIL